MISIENLIESFNVAALTSHLAEKLIAALTSLPLAVIAPLENLQIEIENFSQWCDRTRASVP
jgi:hypothetical protein